MERSWRLPPRKVLRVSAQESLDTSEIRDDRRPISLDRWGQDDDERLISLARTVAARHPDSGTAALLGALADRLGDLLDYARTHDEFLDAEEDHEREVRALMRSGMATKTQLRKRGRE